MKTAIVYFSKYGTTEKVAHLIGEQLNWDEVYYISLKTNKTPDIKAYDKIIIGTSIYAGNPAKAIKNFCNKNKHILESKKIGLYICCMEKQKGQEQLENAYPAYLQNIAIAKGIMGGEFLFDKMNFLERFAIKRIAKTDISISNINKEAIRLFSDRMMTRDGTDIRTI